jgi:pimeloyl-ACP methyl ester carboxylesterase
VTILQQMRGFTERYGRTIQSDDVLWRYYRLGTGTPLLWLTGGLRRAGLGCAFLERLALYHTVLAPDYPPMQTMEAFSAAFDAILHAEAVDDFTLAGQSYGGFLAQAYLAHRVRTGGAPEILLLSSSGPATYANAWLPVEYAAIALARVLPEPLVKQALASGLRRVVSAPEVERAEWLQAIETVLRDDLARADVVSHFAVAADVIHSGLVTPAAFRDWHGQVVVLSATDDPTQSAKDLPRYEQLFGRAVALIDTGAIGHTGLLFHPAQYADIVEQALTRAHNNFPLNACWATIRSTGGDN